MSTKELVMVRWTYVLGIALLVAAAAVYMESWWHVFERVEQVAVTFGFLLLFFVIAYLCQREYPYFSRLSFFAGMVCIGPAIALVGNIYHSQAESYWLFLFWLLPVLLVTFQLQTRPLLILRFLLFQGLLWTFIFPSYFNWPQAGILSGLLTAALLNALIYWWSVKNGRDALLHHAWFTAVLFFPFCGAVRYVLPEVEVFAGIAYVGILAAAFYAVRRKPAALKITIGFTGLYVMQFLLITMLDVYSSAVFIIIFLLAAGAVYGSVKFISSYAKRHPNSRPHSKSFLLHTVTLVGALVAAGAFGGFLGLFLFEALTAVLFVSVLLLFSFVLWKKEMDPYLSQSIVFFSMFQLIVLSSSAAIWQMVPLLLMTALIWVRAAHVFQRIFIYAAGNAALLTWLFLLMENAHLVVWSTAGLNLALALAGYTKFPVRLLYLSGYLFTLLLLFQLPYTVMEAELLYWSYLIGYFAVLTGLLYFQMQQKDRTALQMTGVLWFVFLFVQYVDLFWAYVHLAFTLFLLGTVFLITAYLVEKRTGLSVKEPSVRIGRTAALAVLVIAAILFIPSVQSEAALRNGEVLWLEVEDYGGGIAGTGNEAYLEIYEGAYEDSFEEGTYVYAQLEETAEGTFSVADIMDSKDKAEKPYLRGRVNTWGGAEFGIDHYPAPGGKVSSVLVRIGTDGVAVIEDVRYQE